MKKIHLLVLLFLFCLSSTSSASIEESIEELFQKKDELYFQIEKIKENEIEQQIGDIVYDQEIRSSTISAIDSPLSPIFITNFSGETLNKLLNGTGLEGLGYAFQQAEEKYQVNSIFLIAIAGLESGYGSSRLAREKNNLFGYNANDSNPYGDASSFSTKEECILKVAQKLKENYLSPNGKYFYGCSIEGVNIFYCSSKDWTPKIKNMMINLYNRI